ncbi:mitochondrial 2-oxodicarboxylate carrier isoform X15 [Dermochelys coriacea]|uniref:mitochondrial 2-oxodicarboxylate carrier isoform X15 n=1 Tax=Dermochelys coriacea TaxID=27794 RepID=UPI001CA98ED1|nr:mitochondrial 2-oxodicarboxylate carrier isoform X15 [Dermochelys coriacea]
MATTRGPGEDVQEAGRLAAGGVSSDHGRRLGGKITSSDPPREILKRSDHLLLCCITLLSSQYWNAWVRNPARGLVEICLMHPLDVVKTRFQIQRGKTDPTSYKSLGDSFRTIFRTEGWFGFYKGILPPIMAETPKRAVKQPSTFVQAWRIITADGLGFRGLNKGLTATLGRHGVFNMVYFGFYFNVKNIIPVNEEPTLEFLRKFGIGLVSGTIASMINIPFDVAKSRIQGPQPEPGKIKYRTCFKTMATVYKEEGFLALYKGLVPKIMRLGPGGAVMLLVYEYAYAWLQENW